MMLRRLLEVAGVLYVVWFTSFIAMPAIVEAMIQSADSIGSHQRISAIDASELQ